MCSGARQIGTGTETDRHVRVDVDAERFGESGDVTDDLHGETFTATVTHPGTRRVYASMIETVTSVGAALSARSWGASAVGLDNATSFLRGTREGRLRATARPISLGRRTQLWEAIVADSEGRAVATGRVRLLCLEAGATVAGQTVRVV